jgi:hypothetical protein
MKHFSIEGDWATLRPYRRWFSLWIPSWVALFVSIPLLAFAFIGFLLIPEYWPSLLFIAVPGGLFAALWVTTRRVPKKFGLIRINRKTNEAIFIDRDGSEVNVQFGCFRFINIEKFVVLRSYSWRAVLSGTNGYLVIDGGLSQKGVINWVSPVAKWLAIPIEISQEIIDGMACALSHCPQINPYPSRTSLKAGPYDKSLG